MSRYRYRPVTSPLPLPRYRDSTSATVTDRYGPFTTVTERYRPLLTVTESSRYLRYKRYQRYINFFKYLFKTHYITIGNACNASNGKIR